MAQRDAWLVVLRADALEDWLKANHPGIQRKGPKGYKSLCNSDTSLVAYLRWCTHGVEIGAVHRAFVVSAATGTEAALKGLKEFNAATAKMYQPLHSMAIERVLPGPVYMAEIYDRETSAVEYEPFTPASKDEMLREVQERASQYGEGFDLKVAAFNRAPATLGRRFIEGTKENIDFARSNVDMAAAAEEDVRDQMDEVSGMAAGPGFAVGLPQNMWSPAMLKAYAKGDENAFDQAYLEFKSRARAELQSDQVRKSMLPELSKAAMQRKLTGNPYKAVIPIVSGIAYVENPIPELVKGSSTPYLRYTRDWEFLAPQSRDRDFEQQVEQQTGASRSSVRVFRALGSGKHWVGVALWQIEEMEDYTEHLLVVTLQSGKSWSVAENKVLRWFSTPSDKPGQHDETGAGGVDFLRWALEYVRQTIAFLKEILERSRGQYAPKPYRIVVGWADPKRERAYAWLTRLGFRKVADGGNGSPAYILDIEKQAKKNPKDLEGRFIPDRYLAGLPTALQKQRIGELTQSRDDYKRGDYSELPTDRIARKMGLVQQSQYTTEAKIRGIEYRGDLRDMAKRVMVFYGHRASAREVSAFAEALRKSFSKGLAAWKSGGHRPGATAQNWAVARVNSLVVGGKTSWTADKKLFEVLPAAVRAKIESMRAMRSNPLDPKDDRDLLGWLGEKVLLDVARASRGAVSRGSRLYGGRESKEAQQEMFQAAAAAALQYLQKKYDAPALRRFMELDEKEEYGRTASQEREYSYMNQEFESAVSRAVAAGKSTIPKQRAEERLGRVVDEESRERMATFFRKQQAAIAILKEFKPLGYVPTEQQIANVLYPKLRYSAPQKALHEYRKLLVNLRLPVYEPLEQASEKTSKRSSVLEISRDVDRTLAQSEITPVQPFAAFEAAEEEEESQKDAEMAMAILREKISNTPPGAEREILVALRAVVPPRGPDNLLVAVQNRSGASLSEVRGVVGKYLATVQTAIEERKQLQLEAAQSKAKSPRLLLKNNRRR